MWTNTEESRLLSASFKHHQQKLHFRLFLMYFQAHTKVWLFGFFFFFLFLACCQQRLLYPTKEYSWCNQWLDILVIIETWLMRSSGLPWTCLFCLCAALFIGSLFFFFFYQLLWKWRIEARTKSGWQGTGGVSCKEWLRETRDRERGQAQTLTRENTE